MTIIEIVLVTCSYDHAPTLWLKEKEIFCLSQLTNANELFRTPDPPTLEPFHHTPGHTHSK